MKLGNRIILFVIIMCFSTVTVSCARESVEIKNTVIAYNRLLTEAHAKPDPSVVDFFASPDEQKRIRANIAFIGQNRRLLISEELALDLVDVKVSGMDSRAEVRTIERWRMYLVDGRTRKQISDKAEFRYEKTYELVKLEGHWVVDRVDKNRTEVVKQEKRED